MKKLFYAGLILSATSITLASCSDNKAAELKHEPSIEKQHKNAGVPVRKDGAAIGVIETDSYVMKLHRAFAYEPKGSEVLAGLKPKEGNKFIYLDVSLKNKSAQKLEGGFLFIALRVTDLHGTEYKKPAAALAAYNTEHPEENNNDEYDALWESFEPNEFHREVVYAVEVPANENNFVLHLPTDRLRKDWKTIPFSLWHHK